MTPNPKQPSEQRMTDGIPALRERVARLEASVALCADLTRVDAQLKAAQDVINKFIALKDYGNGVLEERVRWTEKALATANVKIAAIDNITGVLSSLEKRVRDGEADRASMGASLATGRLIATTALTGLVGLIVALAAAIITGALR